MPRVAKIIPLYYVLPRSLSTGLIGSSKILARLFWCFAEGGRISYWVLLMILTGGVFVIEDSPVIDGSFKKTR